MKHWCRYGSTDETLVLLWIGGSGAPEVGGGFHDQVYLGALLVEGEGVAVDGGGEAALGGQAQAVSVDVAGGGFDAAPEVVFGFQDRGLGGDQAEDDDLVF
jgi:hypothetical protein